jgi:pyruvate dehydrogenase E1 component
LRRFFEVDRHHIVVAALDALARKGIVDRARVGDALRQYGVDAGRAHPWRI